jgi:type IV pilus assembly protein PilV
MAIRTSSSGYTSNGRQRGFSLLEVLVAATLLAIALLGLASMQTSALRFNQGAYLHTQAAILAGNMVERIRANLAAGEQGLYVHDQDNPDSSVIADCNNDYCDTAELARFDIAQWLEEIQKHLPQGTGRILRDDTTSSYNITVIWNDEASTATSSSCPDIDLENVECVNVTFQI